ncbi:uncharacterized protein EDB93DRAFT_1239623 [Suillus bovinus]|uniref:uncharacterized protein n=1 Tax=Suillus bovinus TaxID=48563 RepID=UPI001B8750D0|nr:uncharacterized protein EDB93DRAFT_1239623 [Suillus bovinus]KAG2154307.1 hypothetical protein EDB93DRAFT_1239623 [Suillus bovinus]
MDADSMVPPPGEEGFSVSHARDEISLYQELETLTMTKTQYYFWASQYNDLTDAFLAYKQDCTPPPISDNDNVRTSNVLLEHRVQTFRSLSPFINVSLLCYGCIGSSPIRPMVAITICTLDMFRQSHQVCPRFSIHAAAKMLCFMHDHLAEQMCTAFDVYLEIHCRINSRLHKFLGRDTENWCMLNSCPACQYKLVDEPTLDFSILCACDGNNSAKLVDAAVRSGEERLDPRSGLSSIWLMESYIDQFKDEVQSAWAHQARQQPSDPDDPWIDKPDSNNSVEPPTICIDRWHNAVPESRKKMFAIFKKSGIFVTVCQHGFLLTICDMV